MSIALVAALGSQPMNMSSPVARRQSTRAKVDGGLQAMLVVEVV